MAETITVSGWLLCSFTGEHLYSFLGSDLDLTVRRHEVEFMTPAYYVATTVSRAKTILPKSQIDRLIKAKCFKCGAHVVCVPKAFRALSQACEIAGRKIMICCHDHLPGPIPGEPTTQILLDDPNMRKAIKEGIAESN